MKHCIYITTLLFLMVGCKQTPTFTLADLKFADIDKEYLAANKVDTTFLISNNEILNLGESDTFGYRTYDKSGNLLIERIREFGGHFVEYEMTVLVL